MSAQPDRAPSPPLAAPPRFLVELDTLIRARHPLLWLVSSEEPRVDGLLEEMAQTHGKVLLAWSVTKGLHRLGGARAQPPPCEGTEDPIAALRAVGAYGEPSLVVLKDFHPYLAEPRVVRALRERTRAEKLVHDGHCAGPVLQLPVELEKEMSVLDVPLPTFRDLAELLRDIIGAVVLVVRPSSTSSARTERSW